MLSSLPTLILTALILGSNGTQERCVVGTDCYGYSFFGSIDCCFNKCYQKPKRIAPCGVDRHQDFICPNGKSFSTTNTNKHELKQEVLKHCAIKGNSQCPNWMYAWKRNENGCSIPKGTPGRDMLRADFEAACVLHDICYNTVGTPKKDCDQFFKYNMISTCILIHGGHVGTRTCITSTVTLYWAVHFGGKGRKEWSDANCKINRNNILYVTIHSAENNRYILAGVDDKDNPAPPITTSKLEPIHFHLNDPRSWTQFVIKDVGDGTYYIRSYIGGYLKCDGGKLEHSYGSNSKARFVISDSGNFETFKNKHYYIYIKHNGDIGCTKDKSKHIRWKMSNIQTDHVPHIFPDVKVKKYSSKKKSDIFQRLLKGAKRLISRQKKKRKVVRFQKR
eukprot:201652_1